MRLSSTTRFATLFAGLFLAFSMIAVDHADARRGGSFGSRGSRTFQSAPPTRTAPQPTAPVERSMTPNTGQHANRRRDAQTQMSQQRPGFLQRFRRLDAARPDARRPDRPAARPRLRRPCRHVRLPAAGAFDRRRDLARLPPVPFAASAFARARDGRRCRRLAYLPIATHRRANAATAAPSASRHRFEFAHRIR